MKTPASKIPHATVETRPERPGGLACPKCGTHIPFTIETLLSERRFPCPNSACGGALRLDTGQSREALALLERFRSGKPG
jgi:hypothetical protein